MLANFFGLILSWLLKWISTAAEEWYQLELRDRRNRKLVTDTVKVVVDEARHRNEEIADNPESIGASIDRLRRLADRRAGAAYSKTNGTLFERGLDAARKREIEAIDSKSESEVSGADEPSA